MAALRVFHLISSGGLYGAEAVVLNLVAALNRGGCAAALGVFDNRHQPHSEIADEAKRLGLQVQLIRCEGRVDWKTARRVREVLDGGRFEILHTHGYKADLYGWVAARSASARLAATAHNWTARTRSIRLYETLDRFALKHFDHVVAVSSPVASILRSSGVPEEKISVIANGIDWARFASASPVRLCESSQQQSRLHVGLVGRLSREKGPDYFLRAARIVLDEFRGVSFVLVGGGLMKEDLVQMSRALAIDDHVVFAGVRRNMPEVYATMDVIVLASRDEGMPVALLEAFAARKAVVATAVGEVPNLVTDGETGLLVTPGDVSGLARAILRLLREADLRRRLGQNAADLVQQRYSADVMATRYLALYGELASQKVASREQRAQS